MRNPLRLTMDVIGVYLVKILSLLIGQWLDICANATLAY